jgi:hypothetical protein
MSNFTPGPWAWDEPSNWYRLSARIYHENAGAFEPIAQVQLSGWPRKVGLANTRLIAAAPDLLAACIALQAEAAARGCGLRIADEAIAKARGTS